MKFLLWALVIYLAWRWYETKKAKQVEPDPPAPAPAPNAGDAVETMVACAQCGLHLPLSEAVIGEGSRHYCCDAHRLSHAQH